MPKPMVIAQLSEPPRTREIIDPGCPLLEAKRAQIESIRRQTFSYGAHERHQLDVYYPLSEGQPEGILYPTLVFFYGGGLVRGSRTSAPSHLVHNNLGAFFASRGILTVIPDYRLLPGIIFPQGSEDVRDALRWVIDNLKDCDPERLFLLAHSAGGMHVAGFLLKPELFASFARTIRGIIFLGVPFSASPGRSESYAKAIEYYGSAKALKKDMPLPLLKKADMKYVAGLPEIWSMVAGSEPRAIVASMREFGREWVTKGGKVEEFVMEGHDHLSPVLALCSDYGEEWGQRVAAHCCGELGGWKRGDNPSSGTHLPLPRVDPASGLSLCQNANISLL